MKNLNPLIKLVWDINHTIHCPGFSDMYLLITDVYDGMDPEFDEWCPHEELLEIRLRTLEDKWNCIISHPDYIRFSN